MSRIQLLAFALFGALFVALLGSHSRSAVAQQDGFIILEQSTYPNVGFQYRWLQEDGTATATVGRLPTGLFAVQSVVGPDNVSVRILGRGPWPTRGALYDLHPNGSMTTVASGPLFANPHMIFPGRDGDAFIVNDHGTRVELLHVSQGQVSVFSSMRLITPTGCAIDPKSGRVVLRGFERAAPARFGYFFLDAHSGNIQSVGTPSAMSLLGATRIGFDVPTDTFVDLRYEVTSRTASFVRFDRTNGIVLQRPLAVSQTYLSAVDMVSASNRGRSVKHWAILRSSFYAPSFLVGLRGDGTVVRASPIIGSFGNISRMMRAASENVLLRLDAAPNDRTLKLNFPVDAGKPYVVVCSLSGYRNGPKLADGRTIPVTMDALSFATLAGGLPGVVGPTTGVLDANGKAEVRVNGNGLGTSASGVKVWASALVLDPNAPSGIAEISPPRIIVMN